MVLEIPECSVTVDDHGVYHLLHTASGSTATAPTAEEAEIQGAILRVAAAHGGDFPFRTGDLL